MTMVVQIFDINHSKRDSFLTITPEKGHHVIMIVLVLTCEVIFKQTFQSLGCGNGKYLDINPDVMKIGSDRCAALTAAARSKDFEVLTSDNLHMPFRDETFDAVLSIAVIHHFATTDRRIAAIKELTRVLRIGGKVLITVWAMEQRHRKFDSQDVLVPWHEPVKSSSEELVPGPARFFIYCSLPGLTADFVMSSS
ncbi:probable tRNA methyltransferase 9B [Caerostris extrusa]|uniref:Probable tRNA methyltransferase 9B n=1 Tax=Caerostris extrusa TaxID=172846 RepID=A0AAV4UW33_CAEEX|nr:probable tRNA methyltransferase 9B [Caerostris extrusa]